MQTSMDAASIEKANRDKQLQNVIDRKEAEEASRKKNWFFGSGCRESIARIG